MILEGDDDTVASGVFSAFLKEGQHPFEDIVHALTFGNFEAREDADGVGTEFAGDLDPVLNEGEIGLTLGGVGDGEVVADAGAADGDAVDKGLALEAVDVIVAGDGGVIGEVVAGGIEGVDVVLSAIVEDIGEGHCAAAESFVEGIGVEGEAGAGAGIARDAALGGKREGGEVEEVAAMELHRLKLGCSWILSSTGAARVKLEFYEMKLVTHAALHEKEIEGLCVWGCQGFLKFREMTR